MEKVSIKSMINIMRGNPSFHDWDLQCDVADGIAFGKISHNGYEIYMEEVDRPAESDLRISYRLSDYMAIEDCSTIASGTDNASTIIPYLIKRMDVKRTEGEMLGALHSLRKKLEDAAGKNHLIIGDENRAWTDGLATAYDDAANWLKRIIS